MYQRRPDEYFNADLEQRRSEDNRLTGRRWPSNSISYAGSLHEAQFMDQLAIALGEVDPRLLARESALRYARASRRPGHDELGPTDIYSIFYYGLGLSLRPLDCTGLPHILAVYHRPLHEVYLDWTLLPDPPYGRAALDQTAWRRAVDSSPVARILLAWCAATHLAENYDVPLVLGYSACPRLVPVLGAAIPLAAAAPVPLGGDTLNRYRKTVLALAALLAPQERLWPQITTLGLRVHMGDPDWRAHLRAEYGYDATWAYSELPGTRLRDGFGSSRGVDPVEQLISVLAERNQCPRLLIEWQLDGNPGILDWDTWSMQLLREVSTLQIRYAAADQYFRSGALTIGTQWQSMARATEIQPIYIRLSW